MTVSRRARFFYTAMRLFYRYVMPAGMPLAIYRRAANQPLFEPMPRDVEWTVGEVSGIPGEWIKPPDAAADRVLLYLHGGGYVLKTPHVHRVLVARLAQASACKAFIVDYRLAPEHPFPAALEDATAAYRGLVAAGWRPAHIVIAGESAGGGLTAALLLHLRDSGDPLPAAACLMSAMLDCTFSDEAILELQKYDPFLRHKDLAMMARHYFGDHDPQHPFISPVFADLQGLPPMLVYAGEHEILRADSVRFAESARAAGVDVTLKVWTGMIHAFAVFAGFIPEGKIAITEIGAFFRRYIS
jgi:epsilon-lactone hydrolase